VIIGLFCLACIGAVVLAAFEPILKKLYTPEAWAEREAQEAEREAQEAEREARTQAALKRLREEGGS